MSRSGTTLSPRTGVLFLSPGRLARLSLTTRTLSSSGSSRGRPGRRLLGRRLLARRLSFSTSPRFEYEHLHCHVSALIARAHGRDDLSLGLLLDLSDVTFIDSTGVALLVRTNRQVAAGRLRLVPVEGQVRRVLELTGLTRYLEFVTEPSNGVPPRRVRASRRA